MNVVKLTRWWRWQGEGDKVKVTRWRWQGAEGPQTNCLLRCPPLQFDASRISRKDWEATRWGGNCPQISGWGERLKDLRIWWDKSDKEDSWDEYEEDNMMTIKTNTMFSACHWGWRKGWLVVPRQIVQGVCRPLPPNPATRCTRHLPEGCKEDFWLEMVLIITGWSWSSQDDLDHHRMILIVIS